MGGEAVVLKTRRLSDTVGNTVFEVTACLDDASVGHTSNALDPSAQAPRLADASNRLTRDTLVESIQSDSSVDDRLQSLESKIDQLLRHGLISSGDVAMQTGELSRALVSMKDADLPAEFILSFQTTLVEEYEQGDIDHEAVQAHLSACLEDYIGQVPEFGAGNRVLIIGPSGSGKTSLIGKLAARALQADKVAVNLKSLDTHKVGAIDEIESYRELFGLESGESEDDSDNNKTLTLIDGGPLPNQIDLLKAFLARAGEESPTHTYLVVPALMRSSDVLDSFKTIIGLEIDGVVGTMTDLTNRLGSLVTACSATNSRLAFTSDAPSGLGELGTPSVGEFASRILACGGGDE